MIRPSSKDSPGSIRIPRESGDDPLSLEEQDARREYSPRERG